MSAIATNVLEKFAAALHKLACKTFPNQEGGSLVDVYVVDRTKYWQQDYELIRYSHKCRTTQDLEEVEDALLSNLKKAIEDMEKYKRLKTHIQKYNQKPIVLGRTIK